MVVVEYDKGILVTGDTPADVYDETQEIKRRCGEVFVSFCTPVQQANGLFVARGNVVLETQGMNYV